MKMTSGSFLLAIFSSTSLALDACCSAQVCVDLPDWVSGQRGGRPAAWKIPTSMCYAETNRAPITLKWVDRNKGDTTRENYRSRLVVREIKSQGQSLIFLEALF
jgi:hypothetical protein